MTKFFTVTKSDILRRFVQYYLRFPEISLCFARWRQSSFSYGAASGQPQGWGLCAETLNHLSTNPESAEDTGLTSADRRGAWALLWPAQESAKGLDHFAGCHWSPLELPQTPPEDVALSWSLWVNMAAGKSERTACSFSKSPPQGHHWPQKASGWGLNQPVTLVTRESHAQMNSR